MPPAADCPSAGRLSGPPARRPPGLPLWGGRGHPIIRPIFLGAVAQLGERSVRNAEVTGSIPVGSTSLAPRATVIRQRPALPGSAAAGDGATAFYVQDVMVLPDRQRQGIGTALMG